MKAMQCTTIETANDDGLLGEGGSSVKRVVIREDLMKDRTPLVKIADVYLHTSFRRWASLQFQRVGDCENASFTVTQFSPYAPAHLPMQFGDHLNGIKRQRK